MCQIDSTFPPAWGCGSGSYWLKCMSILEAFRKWFEERKPILVANGISIDMPAPTEGLLCNSIHADLRSPKREWTAQLWENGLSDFDFLDWDDVNNEVETTHYEFETEDELFSTLERTLERMIGS